MTTNPQKRCGCARNNHLTRHMIRFCCDTCGHVLLRVQFCGTCYGRALSSRSTIPKSRRRASLTACEKPWTSGRSKAWWIGRHRGTRPPRRHTLAWRAGENLKSLFSGSRGPSIVIYRSPQAISFLSYAVCYIGPSSDRCFLDSLTLRKMFRRAACCQVILDSTPRPYYTSPAWARHHRMIRLLRGMDLSFLVAVLFHTVSLTSLPVYRCNRCCAENPSARPTLREVLEKVVSILQNEEARSSGGAAATNDPSQNVDLLQLFDPIHSSSVTANGRNGGVENSGGGEKWGREGGSREGGASSHHRASSGGSSSKHHARPQPPPPPPPPYDTAIQESTATPSRDSAPPPYLEAVAAPTRLETVESTGSLPAPADSGANSTTSLVSPGTRVTASNDAEELVELSTAYGEDPSAAGHVTGQHAGYASAISTAAGTTKPWWEAPNAHMPATTLAVAGGERSGGVVVDQRYPPILTLPVGGSIGNDVASSCRNGSISCTRSTSLSEYGVDLPGVLQAAMGGGVLSSNARLLCVCCAGPSPEAVDGEVSGAGGVARTGATAVSATLPPAEGVETGGVVQQDAGHVSVLDLWHRGRTVRYPAAADRAAMSPNQSESVIAVHGGGSLHVFSIPRRCRLQELAVAAELCLWR